MVFRRCHWYPEFCSSFIEVCFPISATISNVFFFIARDIPFYSLQKKPVLFLLRTNKTRFFLVKLPFWQVYVPVFGIYTFPYLTLSNMGTIGANLREALAKENICLLPKIGHWWVRSSQFWWCVNFSWWSLCFGWLIIIRLFLQLAKVYESMYRHLANYFISSIELVGQIPSDLKGQTK